MNPTETEVAEVRAAIERRRLSAAERQARYWRVRAIDLEMALRQVTPRADEVLAAMDRHGAA